MNSEPKPKEGTGFCPNCSETMPRGFFTNKELEQMAKEYILKDVKPIVVNISKIPGGMRIVIPGCQVDIPKATHAEAVSHVLAMLQCTDANIRDNLPAPQPPPRSLPE